MESERPNRPKRITGFRPIWSESLLQYKTVHAWVAKNKECWKPNRAAFQRNNCLSGSVAYHDSNIVANFGIVLCNVQTPYQLRESASQG